MLEGPHREAARLSMGSLPAPPPFWGDWKHSVCVSQHPQQDPAQPYVLGCDLLSNSPCVAFLLFSPSSLSPPLCFHAQSVSVAQSCPTLCHPMDCSPPGSSVHGDSPGQNTGVGSHALLQGILPTQRSIPGLLHCRWILYQLSHQRSLRVTPK